MPDTIRQEILDGIKQSAKENPNAVLCAARAIALAVIILSAMPAYFGVIHTKLGTDVIIVWKDDKELLYQARGLMYNLMPSWGVTPPEDKPTETFPPPTVGIYDREEMRVAK